MINNRYSIIKKIGEGRSKVFSCTDKYFPDEIIAIKILQYTASDAEIESFKKEYEIIKRLTHPNIISVYDKGVILNIEEEYKTKYDISEKDKFITMEWVDGVDFDKCFELKNEKILLDVIHQISLVLFYIHESNYIYYDLKPENVLVYKSEGKLKIKIIDFGLACYFPNLESNYICGTAEYLAPEMLKKEVVQFNIDLYAFGIMLYHLAYSKFPFSNENELEIFRAHIGKNFEFPSCKYSNRLIALIKKLLIKNPKKRFSSSLEIIEELNQKITFEDKISLSVPLKFIKREKPQNKIISFMEENSWGNIAVVIGEKGSGKTALLENIFQNNDNSIFIKPIKFNSSFNFWQQFFSQLLYNEIIYRSIDDSLLQYISIHINDNSEELQSELRTIISKIASVSNFTLIIDDYDKLSAQDTELFINLFSILLANQIKIVLIQSNSEEIEIASGIEKEIISIEHFSDDEIGRLVINSCNNFLDKNELENLLILYSERTPAAISYFISELFVSGIIDFKNGIMTTEYNNSKITKLLFAQDEIFKLQKDSLTQNELEVLETISLFENSITVELIAKVLGKSYESILKTINILRVRNILTSNSDNRYPNFINLGFKQYIYKSIVNSQEKHLFAGRKIIELSLGVDDLDKINQFELAKSYDEAKTIIDNILASPQNNNFPKYKIKLLHKKLLYPLSNNEKADSLLSLCEILYNIGEFTESLKIIDKLNQFELQKDKKFQKEKLLGILLLSTGDVINGINRLLGIVDELPEQKDTIYLDLAGAYIDLNNYVKADEICHSILKSTDEQNEIKGRALNLLGISILYNKSDLKLALSYFKESNKTYYKANNFNRIAGSELNLGNIFNMIGDYNNAEKHWNKALQINKSLGNVEQEANVLLNTGVFYYEHANYEKAISVYKKAGNIFKGLGNKYSFGLINSNLCETYLTICEYQKSFDSIQIAKSIFARLNNNDEYVEALLLEAKLFISISNTESLKENLNIIKDYLPIKSNRGKYQFEYYSLYLEKMKSENLNLENINFIKNELSINNERLFAAEIQLMLANEFCNNEDYEISISLLNEKILTDVCEFNQMFEAHRFYILSKIPINYQMDSSLSQNILLQKSFYILQNNSISEFTVLVINDLAKFYFDRGNNNKAREYAEIVNSILNYIKSETQSEVILQSLFISKFSSIANDIKIILN